MSSQILPYYPPKCARMHEVCGPGATGFAAVLMAKLGGQVLWVRDVHKAEHLNPLGLSSFTNPSRLLVANVSGEADRLAVTEEALRAGVLKLVVAEITKPLSLTAGRRLQLAAKAGNCTGLCLIPEGMGSNSAETRWHTAPILHDACPDSTPFRWSLIKNKSGTLDSWYVRWDYKTHCLHVVSPVRERPVSQDASD